jgi:xanthine permease XanP
MISIIILNRSSNQWIRLSSIVIGLVIGFIVALVMGEVNTSQVFAVQESISIPIPFRYGFDFDIIAFIPIALIYVITAIESSGDITANCMISKQDVKGEGYINRIKNGVLGDGVNSAIAAVLTLSQIPLLVKIMVSFSSRELLVVMLVCGLVEYLL